MNYCLLKSKCRKWAYLSSYPNQGYLSLHQHKAECSPDKLGRYWLFGKEPRWKNHWSYSYVNCQNYHQTWQWWQPQQAMILLPFRRRLRCGHVSSNNAANITSVPPSQVNVRGIAQVDANLQPRLLETHVCQVAATVTTNQIFFIIRRNLWDRGPEVVGWALALMEFRFVSVWQTDSHGNL